MRHLSSVPQYEIDPETGCWNWLKGKTIHGYPMGYPHRRFWEKANGKKVPKGWHTHHKCKNTSCVNPDHVEPIHPREHHKHHFLGERTGGLTLDDIAEIRRLGTTVATSHEVGAQFGISEATVRDYWRGRRWAPETGGGTVKPIGRKCARCCGEISPERSRKALYCTKACQMAYNREKRRRAAA